MSRFAPGIGNDDPDAGGELAYPGREETEADCDEVDNDCNGTVDDLWPDLDEDGYTACQGDCDDEAGWGNPDVLEICDDDLDNDCDGDADAQDLECATNGPSNNTGNEGLIVQGRVPEAWFCAVQVPPTVPSASGRVSCVSPIDVAEVRHWTTRTKRRKQVACRSLLACTDSHRGCFCVFNPDARLAVVFIGVSGGMGQRTRGGTRCC